MNRLFSSRLAFQLLLFVLSLACLHLFATLAFADFASSASLRASFYNIVSDRSRLIQVSLVFVTVGCFLIWKYR